MEKGVLAIWTDVDPANEAEFNDWYVREHVAERVGIPGFLSGQRYAAVAAEKAYFAWYEAKAPEILQSPAYFERLQNPTPWTERVAPWFVSMKRAVCRERAGLGAGIGGAAATLDIRPKPEHKPTLSDWIAETIFPDLMGVSGVTGARLWQADPELAQVAGAEKSLGAGPDQAAASWILLIEAARPDDLTALRGSRVLDRLVDHGAEAGELNVYQLHYALRSDEI